MIRWLALERRLAGDGGPSIGNACPPMTSPPTPPGNVPLIPPTGIAGHHIGFPGHNYGDAPGTIHVGAENATIVLWTNTYVEVILPSQADFSVTTPVTLTRADGHTTTMPAFTTTESSFAATLTALSQAGGPAGLSLTLTGTHFEATPTTGGGTGGVTVHGVPAVISFWSDTSIIIVVPAAVSDPDTGNVIVTTGEGSVSNGLPFETVPDPHITSLSAATGQPGTSLNINGNHFLASQGAGSVLVCGVAATVTGWSNTLITVTVPTEAVYPTAGTVTVTSNFGRGSNAVAYSVTVPNPVITSLSASTGLPGDSVTLTGTHFLATQGGGGVKVDGTTAAVTSWADTAVTITVPTRGSYPDTGNVVLTTSGALPSNGVSFTTTAPGPAISDVQQAAVSVVTADAGTYVTVIGVRFGASQGAGSVTVNGVAATVMSWSDTSIRVLVPYQASFPDTNPIIVTDNGGTPSGPFGWTTTYTARAMSVAGAAELTRATDATLSGECAAQQWAVSLWVNLTNVTGTFYLAGKVGADLAHFQWDFDYQSTNFGFHFEAYIGASTFNLLSGVTVAAGGWHHLFVIKSGNNLTLWVDGAQVAQNNLAPGSWANANVADLTIGVPAGGSGVFGFSDYEGLADQLAIWNGAAVPAVGDLYAAGAGVTWGTADAAAKTNVVVWYEMTSAGWEDQTGGGRDMTASGSVSLVAGKT